MIYGMFVTVRNQWRGPVPEQGILGLSCNMLTIFKAHSLYMGHCLFGIFSVQIVLKQIFYSHFLILFSKLLIVRDSYPVFFSPEFIFFRLKGKLSRQRVHTWTSQVALEEMLIWQLNYFGVNLHWSWKFDSIFSIDTFFPWNYCKKESHDHLEN